MLRIGHIASPYIVLYCIDSIVLMEFGFIAAVGFTNFKLIPLRLAIN